MQLIEIQEPNEFEEEIVVGIDFGTTNSLVAFAKGKSPFVLTEESNPNIAKRNAIIPSIVSMHNNDFVVGAAGRNTIRSIKRILGKKYDEISDLKGVDKKLIFNDNGNVKFKIDNYLYDPEFIASLIFSELKKRASKYFNKEIKKAVVTSPAYFNDQQRNAIKRAANIAGLEVIRILNEPTAAAFAYGLNNKAEGKFLVYDLGGGTFDISLLNIMEGIIQVIAVNGNTMLGGDDIDKALHEYINNDLNINISLSEAKHIKEQFYEHDRIEISENIFLSIEEFEKITLPILQQTIDLAEETLNHTDSIEGIILIGGSTRIKLIPKLLKKFNVPLLDDIDTDMAVAMGAGLHAENLSKTKSHVILDVVPLSLGIETAGGIVEKLIYKNTPLPAVVTKMFTTYADNQTAIKFNILQGEREFANDCNSIGFFELKNIPPMLAGSPKVKVNFMIDADGILYVSAQEESSGSSKEIIIKHKTLHYDEKDLERAMKMAKKDHHSRQIIETINNAQLFINQIKRIILSPAPEVQFLMKELQTAIDNKNIQTIVELKDKLEKLL